MDGNRKKLACSRRVADAVPESLIREAQIFPIECTRKHFTFAVAAPLGYEWLETLEFVLDREVREVIYPIESIVEAIHACYGEAIPDPVTSFLWLNSHLVAIAADGTISIKNSSWWGNRHSTGFQDIAPESPDYEFWTWLIAQEEYARVVNESELPEIREHWRQAQATGRE